jgi:hypothetical protein
MLREERDVPDCAGDGKQTFRQLSSTADQRIAALRVVPRSQRRMGNDVRELATVRWKLGEALAQARDPALHLPSRLGDCVDDAGKLSELHQRQVQGNPPGEELLQRTKDVVPEALARDEGKEQRDMQRDARGDSARVELGSNRLQLWPRIVENDRDGGSETQLSVSICARCSLPL